MEGFRSSASRRRQSPAARSGEALSGSHPHAATRGHRVRRPSEGTELGVVDADGYLQNEARRKEEESRQRRGFVLNPAQASPVPAEPREKHSVTPSEASWSSQTSTRSDPLAGCVAPPSNRQGRGLFSSACGWPLARSCPCASKKAVGVEERYAAPRSSANLDLEGIGFVSLNKKGAAAESRGVAGKCAASANGGETAAMGAEEKEMLKLSLVAEILGLPDLPANSSTRIPNSVNSPELEVFQPASTALRWHAFRPPFIGDGWSRRTYSSFPASPIARLVASAEDELASDSSSDLFELEGVSMQMTPLRPAYPRGSPLDENDPTPRGTRKPPSSGGLTEGSRQPWTAASAAEGAETRVCRREECPTENCAGRDTAECSSEDGRGRPSAPAGVASEPPQTSAIPPE